MNAYKVWMHGSDDDHCDVLADSPELAAHDFTNEFDSGDRNEFTVIVQDAAGKTSTFAVDMRWTVQVVVKPTLMEVS